MIKEDLKLNTVENYLRYQARVASTKTSHVNALTESFKVPGFHYTQLPPISIVEYGDGSREVIDGNNRIKALRQAGESRVIANVYSFSKDMDNDRSKVIKFAGEANGNRKPELSMSTDDLKRNIKGQIKEGIDVDLEEWRTEFAAIHSRDPRSVGMLVSNARKDINVVDNNLRVYSKNDLKPYIAEYEDEGVSVVATNSGKWAHGLGSLIKDIALNDNDEGVLIIHHRTVNDAMAFCMTDVVTVLEAVQLVIEIVILTSNKDGYNND